jgi:hypothetical protein
MGPWGVNHVALAVVVAHQMMMVCVNQQVQLLGV